MQSALILLLLLPTVPQDGENPDWNVRTCKEYTLEQLETGAIPIGGKAWIDLKYGSLLKFLRPLQVTAQMLPVWEEPPRELRDLDNGDNMRVFGIYQGPPGKAGEFHVHHLEPLPSDADVYREMREKIDPESVEDRLALGDWAMGRYAIYQNHVEDLRENAIRDYNKAVQLLEERAAADDYDTHLRIAKIIQERIGDRGRALEKIKESCLPLKPQDPELERYLAEKIGAVWYRKDWVKYEEFKRAEGFLQRPDGTWVREPIFHLEKFAADTPKPETRIVPDAQARDGTAIKGMKPYQMILAKSYPEYILRIDDNDDSEVWVYPDGYYFFWNEKYYQKVARTGR